jgi:thioredoxin 1
MDDITKTTGLVLVDFSATWCGPCQMLAPIIDEIEKERPDVHVIKVDVDSNPEISNQYNVSSVPTVIVFNNGQVKATVVGFRQKQEYLKALEV